jgi:L-threonylcarbamoyladenylate synthase
VATAVHDGELVVFPTETVYGVAARADVPEATARLFAVKRRRQELALPVLGADSADVIGLGELSPLARALAARFWPGPLTLVVRRNGRSSDWRLGARSDSIGIRVPHHAAARAILRRTGPIAVTSANRSGLPPAATREALVEALGSDVAVYVVAAEPLDPEANPPSTVVDVTTERPRVLRRGALPLAALAQAADEAGVGGDWIN